MSEPPRKDSLWRRWVVRPVMTQLTQGIEPRRLALAIAFGVTTGVFPLLGTTIIVSLLIGLPMKLNQPVMQTFRELMYPVHLATIIGFIHAGERLFGVPHTSLSIGFMLERFKDSPSQFLADYGMLGVYAVAVWVLMAPFMITIVYWVSKPLVTKLSERMTRQPEPQG